jgi:hypothetical protein
LARMPAVLHPSDVVIAFVTENMPRLLTQSIRLLRSIRWFGGELANARVVVAGVGPLGAEARRTLEALGAEVRTVPRFHPASPTGNRLQVFAALADAREKLFLILDCDTVVLQDPLPFLSGEVFQGKIAPAPTVTDEVFDRLFAHFRLPKPPLAHMTRLARLPTIAYFNAGVLAIPAEIAKTLAPSWRKFNQILADRPELAAPCHKHLHQAALALALAETGVPYAELPDVMNLQINARHLAQPPGFAESDPVILHYHQFGSADGFLLPCPYPGPQARIERFNARMRAEGFVEQEPAAVDQDSRPIVVLGMHRSGTSVVTEIIRALGSHAGESAALTPPDIFNPGGYWEHKPAVELDNEILDALSANWTDRIVHADPARLTAEQRGTYVTRAKEATQSLRGHGSFVIKDPRMSLLFPLWREALGDPVCVIVWREPVAVAQSLLTRDGQPLLSGLAAWEHHCRTILRDTEGLPRLLVSYEALVADPVAVTRELCARLTAFGVPGLTMPSGEGVLQIVNADFNRSGQAKHDDSLLDPHQRELRDALRSGAALSEPVPPTSARTFALLEQFGAFAKRESDLRAQIAELDQLLGAVFTSRSWRIGHRVTGLVRRGNAISAMDRWQESRRRRHEQPS